MSEALGLGDRVAFDYVLARISKPGEFPGRCVKVWERIPWGGAKTGVVVGVRTLQDGEVVYGGGSYYDYEPNTWRAKSTVPAVLVAENLRRKPIYVHRDDVQRLVPLENTVSSDEKAQGAEPWPSENQVFAAAMTCAASEPRLVMVKEADWQRIHEERDRARSVAVALEQELARKDQALDEIRALHSQNAVDVANGDEFCEFCESWPCPTQRILSDLAAALDAQLNKEDDQ